MSALILIGWFLLIVVALWASAATYWIFVCEAVGWAAPRTSLFPIVLAIAAWWAVVYLYPFSVEFRP